MQRIQGMFVGCIILCVVISVPKANAVRAAGCNPCPALQGCLWNPRYIIPNDCLNYENPPDSACKCLVRECNTEFLRKIPTYQSVVDASTSTRPEGSCSTIPCGECFELCETPCEEWYVCVNAELEVDCVNDIDCKVELGLLTVTMGWEGNGKECCVDAF